MVKLHLGCGEIHLKDWCNIDARPGPSVDRVADIAALTPDMFPEGVEAIYACHVLEHFGFGCVEPTAQNVLASWVNLLMPGGAMFISVPDLKAIGRAIANTSSYWHECDFIKAIYGGCEYPLNRHFVGFTETVLANMFWRVGLTDVMPFESFADDTSRFILHGCPVSLNLKATRG